MAVCFKNVGEGAMDFVVQNRREKGPFTSIYDFQSV